MRRPSEDNGEAFWPLVCTKDMMPTQLRMEEWEVGYLTAKFEIDYECGRYTKDLGYGVDEAGNGFFRDRW